MHYGFKMGLLMIEAYKTEWQTPLPIKYNKNTSIQYPVWTGAEPDRSCLLNSMARIYLRSYAYRGLYSYIQNLRWLEKPNILGVK